MIQSITDCVLRAERNRFPHLCSLQQHKRAFMWLSGSVLSLCLFHTLQTPAVKTVSLLYHVKSAPAACVAISLPPWGLCSPWRSFHYLTSRPVCVTTFPRSVCCVLLALASSALEDWRFPPLGCPRHSQVSSSPCKNNNIVGWAIDQTRSSLVRLMTGGSARGVMGNFLFWLIMCMMSMRICSEN